MVIESKLGMDLNETGKRLIKSNLGTSAFLGRMPYLIFLAFLGIVYIANANFSQKKIREIQKTQLEIKSLRWEAMALKSELAAKTKRSQVVKQMADLDLQIPRQQLKKIIINKK